MANEKRRGSKEAKKEKSTLKGAKSGPKYMTGTDLGAPKPFLPKAGGKTGTGGKR